MQIKNAGSPGLESFTSSDNDVVAHYPCPHFDDEWHFSVAQYSFHHLCPSRAHAFSHGPAQHHLHVCYSLEISLHPHNDPSCDHDHVSDHGLSPCFLHGLETCPYAHHDDGADHNYPLFRDLYLYHHLYFYPTHAESHD